MRTVRTKVYQFNELNDEAKQVAIDKNREINVDYKWWVFTYEDAENIGLKLNGFDLDINKHATGKLLQDAYYTANEIIKNHGVTCETYKTANDFIEFWNEAVKLHSDGIITDKVADGKEDYFDEYVADSEEKFLKDILSNYADILQNECDYLQTDEAVKETLIANEYEFTKEGNIF